MYTVIVKWPHLSKPKEYIFKEAKHAERFADEVMAAGVRASLGFSRQLKMEVPHINIGMIH